MNDRLPARPLPAAEPMRRRRVGRTLLGAATLLLGACSGSLLPAPPQPPARFALEAGAPVATARAAAASAPVLVVEQPIAAPGYDSRHMVYLRRPQELEAFAFHEWVAPPAQMLAPMLVAALQDGAGFRVVLASPSAAAGAWRLESELQRLQHDFTRRPSRVRLSLRAVLLDGATRQALAWRQFDVDVAAAGDDPVAGAAAAQDAARQLVAAVAAFCAEQALAAAPSRR